MFTDEPYGCWIPESGVNNMQQMCDIFVAWIAWRIALEKEMLGKMPQKTWGHGRIVLVGWHTREVKSVSFSRGQSGSKTCWENWLCTSNQIGRKMRNAIIRDLLRLPRPSLATKTPTKMHSEKAKNFQNVKQCADVISKSADANVFLRRSLWASEVSKIDGRPPFLRLIAHVGALVTGSRDVGDGREIVSRQRSQTGKNTPTL